MDAMEGEGMVLLNTVSGGQLLHVNLFIQTVVHPEDLPSLVAACIDLTQQGTGETTGSFRRRSRSPLGVEVFDQVACRIVPCPLPIGWYRLFSIRLSNDWFREFILLKYLMTCSAVGFGLYSLNARTGVTYAVHVTDRHCELAQANRESLEECGLACIGDQCEPNDKIVSDIVALEAVATLKSVEWPVRIWKALPVDDFEWITFHSSPTPTNNPDSMLLSGCLSDFHDMAHALGLDRSPGIECIDDCEGRSRLVPTLNRDEPSGDPADLPFDRSIRLAKRGVTRLLTYLNHLAIANSASMEYIPEDEGILSSELVLTGAIPGLRGSDDDFAAISRNVSLISPSSNVSCIRYLMRLYVRSGTGGQLSYIMKRLGEIESSLGRMNAWVLQIELALIVVWRFGIAPRSLLQALMCIPISIVGELAKVSILSVWLKHLCGPTNLTGPSGFAMWTESAGAQIAQLYNKFPESVTYLYRMVS
jgi:hypothetical protein